MTRSSQDWCMLFDIDQEDIQDPDGWDRLDFNASWEEEITIEEFEHRMGVSTVRFTKPIIAFFDFMDGARND